MAGRKVELSELVNSKLAQDEQMHFNYHKLYLNGIDLKNGSEVTRFIQDEYMQGLSLEEYALTNIVEQIKADIQKLSAKYPVKADKTQKTSASNKNV